MTIRYGGDLESSGEPSSAVSVAPNTCEETVPPLNQPAALQFLIRLPFEAAEKAVREALQAQGFGVLTEVDAAAVLRAKLGVEIPPHKLLGACNPNLAHASIAAAPSIGAFLPCGVAIRAGASEDEVIVAIQNPALLAGLFDVPELAAPAEEARRRLVDALSGIETATAIAN